MNGGWLLVDQSEPEYFIRGSLSSIVVAETVSLYDASGARCE